MLFNVSAPDNEGGRNGNLIKIPKLYQIQVNEFDNCINLENTVFATSKNLHISMSLDRMQIDNMLKGRDATPKA